MPAYSYPVLSSHQSVYNILLTLLASTWRSINRETTINTMQKKAYTVRIYVTLRNVRVSVATLEKQ